jgi:hypothetical protein
MNRVTSVFPPGSRAHLFQELIKRRDFPARKRVKRYVEHVLDEMRQEEELIRKGNTLFSFTIEWDNNGHVGVRCDHFPHN